MARKRAPLVKAPEKWLRADAARNRARILDAAEQVFAAQGPTASTEEVARIARVGIGTVFRHFPTKEVLLETLLVVRLTKLAGEIDAVALDNEDNALFVSFVRLVEQAAKKRPVVAALAAAGVDVKALLTSAGRELHAAVGRLLLRAQKAGLVRKDVGVAEVLGILMGVAHAAEQGGWDKEMQGRVLEVIFDGLRRH